MMEKMIVESSLCDIFLNLTMWNWKYFLENFRIIGSNFITNWLKDDFRLSFSSEEILFDPNFELKFQISHFLEKCFEYNLQEKLAFWTEM
jgi:hypothetical protein